MPRFKKKKKQTTSWQSKNFTHFQINSY